MSFPINERLTEGLTVLDLINAYPTLTTVQTGGKADLSRVRKVMYVFQAGTLGASAVVTCKLQGCATSGGSYTDIAGSSFTLVKATDDNKALVIETDSQAVNALGLGYRYVQYAVVATVSSDVRVASIGAAGVEEPIASQNVAGVKSLNVVS